MTRMSVGLLLAAIVGAAATSSAQAQDNATAQLDGSQLGNCGRPCQQSCLELTASLLYLQPCSNNLEYGTLVSPLPLPTPNWANQAIDPHYAPAFNVGMRYTFGESCTDLAMDWTHLQASDSNSFSAGATQFVGPPFEIGPDASGFQIGDGEVKFEFDAVNLEVGHTFFAGDVVQVRVFGGLQFARITEDLSGNFRSLDDLSTNDNTTESAFTGAGPRFGVDAKCVAGNFDFVGEMGVAALIGTMKSRLDFSATSPVAVGDGVPQPNLQSLTSPDATQVIPCIDCKLGTGYTLAMRRCGTIRIEGGYQAAVYINAINEYSITEVDTPPDPQSVGIFLRTQNRQQSDFIAQGPYLTGSWSF